MDEDQYRKTYQEVNQQRCVFEKLILLRYGSCQNAEKLFLAEREAMACHSTAGQTQCLQLLNELRQNARFSLHLTSLDGPLPHAQEIKVQAGGIFGLQQALKKEDTANTANLSDEKLRFDEEQKKPIDNVSQVIEQGLDKFGDFSNFPYSEIVKSILHFSLPKRRNSRKK